MANICLYKVMVKGPKLNCYKLVDMMPLGDWEKDYLFEEGTDDNFTLIFIGGCKWAVDYRTSRHRDIVPFTKEQIEAIQDGDYWEYPLNEKSILLGVDIMCNSKDIDDSCWAEYEHYNKGKAIYDECPKELHIKKGRDYDNGYDVVLPLSSIVNQSKDIPICKVKFQGGAYWYKGDFEVGDIVKVDGKKAGVLGRVIEKSMGTGTDFANVVEKIGHVGDFIIVDIEKIYSSRKTADRREWLKNKGFDEKTTKVKFVSLMEWEWVAFALENNNWSEFLKYVNEN